EWAELFACQATVGTGCTGSSPDRVTANLRDVDSTASDSFIAVGDSGTIIREANGVISTVPTPAEASSSSLRAIDIVSSSRMTTVGSDGTILTSPNGVSWTPQYACTSNDPTTPCTAQSGDRVKATLQDVSFTTSLGFAVGQGGVVLKAPDASSNPQTAWKVQSSPTTDNLNGVVATETGAYAVGDNGTVLLGSNTGTSWEKVFVCTASDPCQQTSSDLVLMPLSSVARPDLKSAVAVGTNGSIVATGTPLLAPSASPSTSTSTSPSPSPSSSGGGGGGGGQRSALSIEYKKAKKEFTGTLISTDKACTRQRIVYVKRASSPPKRVASTVTDRHGKWRAFLPQVRPGRYFALSPSDDRGHVTCEKAKSAKVRVR
ncbi:MAG: hypothetical protein QOC87_604, partial [Actinomycetota bacterium]|nr:hypothetical protein [Actinomycetota bacterium]